jgi:hypothetical protein
MGFAGNIRLGLYRDNGDTPAGGALVVETASVALANFKNEVVIADTVLEPGLYWFALQNDDATPVFITSDQTESLGGTLQCYVFAQGYGAFTDPCPAVAFEMYTPLGFVRVVPT